MQHEYRHPCAHSAFKAYSCWELTVFSEMTCSLGGRRFWKMLLETSKPGDWSIWWRVLFAQYEEGHDHEEPSTQAHRSRPYRGQKKPFSERPHCSWIKQDPPPWWWGWTGWNLSCPNQGCRPRLCWASLCIAGLRHETISTLQKQNAPPSMLACWSYGWALEK